MSFRIILYAALFVTFAASYSFYRSVVRIFGITRPSHKKALFIILAVLSVSYLPVHYLSHQYDNLLTTCLSVASGLWLGFFLYMFIASICARLFLYVFDRAGRPISARLTGMVFLGMALMFTVYGVWSAFNPRVTEVRVSMAGLPEDLSGMTVVQISDVHLGRVHGAGFMDKVVSRINSLGPDMVVITGDLFDGGDGTLHSLAAPLAGLKARYGVYSVNGNHDNHRDAESVRKILDSVGVRQLDDKVVDIGGLQVVGMSYRRGDAHAVSAGLLNSLEGYSPERPAILLYHSPVVAESAAEAGVDLQLSGHSHRGQLFPFGYITRLIYHGHDYGLHKIGAMMLYTTNGTGTWGPPIRTGTPPEIVRITIDRS